MNTSREKGEGRFWRIPGAEGGELEFRRTDEGLEIEVVAHVPKPAGSITIINKLDAGVADSLLEWLDRSRQ